MEPQSADRMPLSFTTLAQQPQWLDQLALWQQREWQNFPLSASTAADQQGLILESQLQERRRKLQAHLQSPVELTESVLSRDSLPQTVLALSEGQLLGCVSLVNYRFSVQSAEIVWLTNLYVRQAWRRRGIGRQLLEQVESLALRCQLQALKLFTHDQSHFYQQLGWRLEGQTRLRGREVMIMNRPLVVGS